MKAGDNKSNVRIKAGFLGVPEHRRITTETVLLIFSLRIGSVQSLKKRTSRFIQNDTELANNCKNRPTQNFGVP